MRVTKENIEKFDISSRKEWIVTNGIGGYAASSIIGLNTRKYHALLVAALGRNGDRYMVLSKLNESLVFDDKTYTYLKELKYAEGYNDLTLAWKDYVDSIYLFRGTRAPSFDTKSLSRRLYLFNMQFKSAGKIIDMSRLKINANFVFIRENFGANPTTQQLNEGFSNVTRKYRVLYKHQYTLWLKVNFEEVD